MGDKGTWPFDVAVISFSPKLKYATDLPLYQPDVIACEPPPNFLEAVEPYGTTGQLTIVVVF
jgi:hypothetical protein